MIETALNTIFIDGLPLELWLFNNHYWYVHVKGAINAVFGNYGVMIVFLFLFWHFYLARKRKQEREAEIDYFLK